MFVPQSFEQNPSVVLRRPDARLVQRTFAFVNQNELKRVDDESLWVADMTPIQGELTIGISNLAGSAGSSTPAFITLVPQVGSPVRTDKLVVSMFSHPSSLDPQTSMEAFDGGRRFSITDREKQASLARYILLLAARNR